MVTSLILLTIGQFYQLYPSQPLSIFDFMGFLSILAQN